MNVEEYIVARVNILMHTQDAKIVKRLEGGMSNYTYVVESNGEKYTYRVPGKYAERFVDRDDEWYNIQQIENLDINNKTIYMELRSGEKLAVYVEGTILTETDILSYNKKAAKALKKLHNSDVQLKDYNPFDRLNNYETYCRQMGFVHPEAYLALRKRLDAMRLSHPVKKTVPCHCDFQPSNLVLSNDKLYVLDWEFAGMNDPFYDIACYGNVGLDKALALLEVYLEHTPTKEEIQRLLFQRAFQCLQWYNVAYFKEFVGLSKDLKMDFKAVAAMFMSMAQELIEKYDNL